MVVNRTAVLQAWNSLGAKFNTWRFNKDREIFFLKEEVKEIREKYDELTMKQFETGLEYASLIKDLRDIKKDLKVICRRVNEATKDVEQKKHYASLTVSGIENMVKKIINFINITIGDSSDDEGPTIEEVD